MSRQDRDRILISSIAALLLHLVIVAALSFADLQYSDYPEITPVFVELPEYVRTPEPEVEREPEPEVAVEEPIVQLDRVEEDPEPQEIGAQSDPEAQIEPAAGEETPAAPTEGGPSAEDLAAYDLRTGNSDAGDRSARRTSDADLFDVDEPASSGPGIADAPEWAQAIASGEAAEIAEEEDLSADVREELDRRSQFDQEFEQKLDEIVNALRNPSERLPEDAEDGNSDGTTDGFDGSENVPGDLDWVGSGRRLVGQAVLPQLTADDFGGRVPASLTFVIVFDVNSAGNIAPNSLFFRQGSGYTAADLKVAGAIRQWRFEPASGAPNATAILTLRLQRGE